MRVKHYLYGDEKIDLKVKVFIVDEVKNKEYNIQTFDVQSDFTLFELKGNLKEQVDIFEKVIKQLNRDFNITKIASKTYQFNLEMVGDFQQKMSYGNNYLRLKLKIVNS
jgi:hypothetical protein